MRLLFALLATWAGVTARAEGAALLEGASGLTLGLHYVGNVSADVAGGVRRGAAYGGRADFVVDADLAALAGWSGTTLHANVFQIHGYGPSAHYVGNILDVSNIEAHSTTRLYSLWVQKALTGGRASLRAGQLAADQEFLISATASNLINGTFGWPALVSANQTSGGPGYPLATPGARLRLAPRGDLAVLLAAFAGNPAGTGCNERPQICDRYGTTFSRGGGTLWMAELQYEPPTGEPREPGHDSYKLGGWYQTGAFADLRDGVLATGGSASLASGLTVGPLEHRDDWGLYAVADRTLWRARGRRLHGFVRLGAAPPDRNLVALYVDAGLGLDGPIAGRPQDTLVLAIARAGMSGDASALDGDRRTFGASGYPLRSYESVLELTYIAKLTPRISVQPDLQYVTHPGGNVPDPADPSRAIRNALVLGFRTTLLL